jgi:putative FmdB family regulatory protein
VKVPTYEYACKECGEHLEAVQKFTDDPLTTCPACSGPLRKVFGSVGISFKGSGFYKTDSRGKSSSSSDGGSKSTEGGSSDSGSKTETKSDTKAADKPAAASTSTGSSGSSTTGSAAAS